jgi:coproporphyrinogen III oxidase
MNPIFASSKNAQNAYGIVKNLQHSLVTTMDRLPPSTSKSRFVPASWLRNQGQFGGGTRYMAEDPNLFNRASVNISQVQYEGDPSRALASASAISTIIHPMHPLAPSLHMHISWTEMKKGQGYWRVMADLNPSHENPEHRTFFLETLREATGDLFQNGVDQGDQYFYIPALKRHRGIAHFYLEQLSRDTLKDPVFAQNFGIKIISCYGQILQELLQNPPPITQSQQKTQLAYHSLYFLQVLTLDRGTTSGLLIHDENDVGILGSLPAQVDKKLLASWVILLPELQQKLLQGILEQLPHQDTCTIDDPIKKEIAIVMRRFYGQFPEAQDLLARGQILPPTVANHGNLV